MPLLFQFGVVLAMLLYLGQRRLSLYRRSRASWQSLNSQLQQWPPDLATPWVRFQRARVLMEMADYAEINGSLGSEWHDLGLVASIRKEAMQTRISALAAMLRFA